MDFRKRSGFVASAVLVFAGLLSIWFLQLPGRNEWNITVALAVSDYYRNSGSFPRSQKELLLHLGGGPFNRGFIDALEEMTFKDITETEFLEGQDLIEIPRSREQQRILNHYLRTHVEVFQDK